jgi:hypothetical protein
LFNLLHMENLIKIGFRNIGHWHLAKDQKSHIECTIRPEYKNIKSTLYCFCVDNKPHYLGITDSLKDRLNNYKSGKEENKSGTTNKKVYTKILQVLNQNKNVNIYILIPKQKITYEGFDVCPYKGLEHTLIKHYDFDEIWNERGTKGSPKKKHNNKMPIANSESFTVTNAGIELTKKGYIHIPKAFQALIPAESCDVQICFPDIKICKSCRLTISGGNRKINANKHLTEWLKNIKPNDNFTVKIHNQKEFEITKQKQDI